MPRSGSMCQASSLLRRTRPGSLAAALFTRALTICFGFNGGRRDYRLHRSDSRVAKLEVHDVRKTDARLLGHWRLDVAVALFALDEFDARRRLLAVDGGAEAAEVLEEKLSRGRIAAQAEVLARDIGQSFELEVGPIVAAAAADHDLFLGHEVPLAAGAVLVFDDGERAGIDGRRFGLRRRGLRLLVGRL